MFTKKQYLQIENLEEKYNLEIIFDGLVTDGWTTVRIKLNDNDEIVYMMSEHIMEFESLNIVDVFCPNKISSYREFKSFLSSLEQTIKEK